MKDMRRYSFSVPRGGLSGLSCRPPLRMSLRGRLLGISYLKYIPTFSWPLNEALYSLWDYRLANA